MKKTIPILLFLISGLLFPALAYAQDALSVSSNQALLEFPDGVRFQLEAKSETPIEKASLLYRTSGRACQAGGARQAILLTEDQDRQQLELEWFFDWRKSGMLPPGVTLWWQWELVDDQGEVFTTEEQSLTIQDQRHTWETINQEGVSVQWYEGDQDFGQALHTIAVESLLAQQASLGIAPPDQINIVVYPTVEDLQEALIVTTEWTGGIAMPDYSSSLVALAPGEEDWAAEILPHELNHLAVEILIFNCWASYLPTWMSEGLAENSIELNLDTTEELLTEALGEPGQTAILPLKQMEQGFSAYGSAASIAYIQSGYVIHYLVDTYGEEKVAELLAGLQGGEDFDDVFSRVYGFDTYELDAQWRESLGFDGAAFRAARPVINPPDPSTIPTIAPFDPLPYLLPSPTPAPTNTPTPLPTATTAPTAVPTSPPPIPTDIPIPPDQGGVPMTLILAGAAAGVVILAAALFILFRKGGKTS